MTTTQPLLQQAIAAAKAGNRAAARDLLLQIVGDDERNEQAWLWLSGVVDDPAEQRIALENVLDINPRNTSALKGMAWLDARLPRPQPAPVVAPAPSAPPTPEPPARALPPIVNGWLPEEPNPCPYCGANTLPSQTNCPICKRSLMVTGERPAQRMVWTTLLGTIWLIFGALSTIGGLLVLFSPQIIRTAIESGNSIPPETKVVLGRFSGAPLIGMVLASLLEVFIGWSLLRRQQIGYIIGIVLLVLNVAYLALTGGPALFCAAAFLLIMGALTALSFRDFFPPQARIQIDLPERKAEEHFNLGLAYKNRGMWYVAAREWEGAVKRRSNDTDYHRALGLAYAQIKEYGRARRELQAAIDTRPGDAQLRDDLATVEKLAVQ